MKFFDIPLLPIRLEQDTDSKMHGRDVTGIELEWAWKDFAPRNVFSGAFVAGGTDGIGISFCAEVPGVQDTPTRKGPEEQGAPVPHGFKAAVRPSKGRVFEDDCLEAFLFPAGSDFYYGWEINPSGACLDYRVAVTQEGDKIIEREHIERPAPAGERVSGIVRDTIDGQALTYDYDWTSHAVWRWETAEEFWYLELFIPWTDFGITERPAPGTIWTATLNRIDEGARLTGTANPGLASLLEDTDIPRFHQPKRFAQFRFNEQQSVQ